MLAQAASAASARVGKHVGLLQAVTGYFPSALRLLRAFEASDIEQERGKSALPVRGLFRARYKA